MVTGHMIARIRYDTYIQGSVRCIHDISSYYARVRDEKSFIGEEAHAAERRVAPLSPEALNVAAHDPRASDYPMNLPPEAF